MTLKEISRTYFGEKHPTRRGIREETFVEYEGFGDGGKFTVIVMFWADSLGHGVVEAGPDFIIQRRRHPEGWVEIKPGNGSEA